MLWEATFSCKLSELNDEMLKKLKYFAGDENAVVTVTVSDAKNLPFSETKDEFIRRIQSRIDEYHIAKYSEEDSSTFSVVNEPEP